MSARILEGGLLLQTAHYSSDLYINKQNTYHKMHVTLTALEKYYYKRNHYFIYQKYI